MKIKYIIFDEISPVLFSETQQHVHFQEVGKPTSAGFCSILEDHGQTKVKCWGESISLKIKSDPEWDESIIAHMFNN